MGLFDRLRNKEVPVSKFQLITDQGNGFFAWNGKIYQSDVVRSAIRPKVRSIGKTVAKHIRENQEGIKVNPEVYMRFLLEEPNPYMTGQMLWEKMATHLELNNNAFAYINRDDYGFPTDIYPITAMATEAIKNSSGELFLKFTYSNGRTGTFRYTDIIHLRKDFNENEIFGESPAASLVPLMEIISTTDQGIVKAIKNSSVIKWLLKFNSQLRPEDIKRSTKQFVTDYLSIESDSVGAAATDAKMDAKQVDPKDYVPNEKQTANTITRVYAFYNTNEKIVRSEYSENDWISYYEACVEPDVVQMSGEFTRKLFNRRERGFGNRILFESSNLAFASLKTKMEFVNSGIDRGMVNTNEGRKIFGLAPIEGGDTYVRRLDTAPVDNKQTENS